MPNEITQQANMFTGDWEPKRTRTPPPKQTSMFTLRETFEFGAKAHPKFAEGGTPALQLIREDIRTPEEVERDLIHEAEKLTQPMFVSEARENESAKIEPIEIEDEDEHEQSVSPEDKEEVTKLSCYRALVSIAYERKVTLWVDTAYRRRFNAQMPQAIYAAQAAGLTPAEIDAAIQIGEYKGSKVYESMPIIYDETVPDKEKSPPALRSSEITTRDTATIEGFRAKLRREHTQVRTRC